LTIPWLGVRGLYVLDAIALLLAGVALLLLMPEPTAPVKRGSVLGRTGEVLRTAWSLEPVRWNFISATTLRGGSAIVESYLPVRITQVAPDPVSAIGWILGIYGVCTTIATWFAGRLLQRFEEATLYIRAVFSATLLTFALALAPSIWLLGVLAVLRSVPTAFSNTVLHTHNALVIPPAQRTAVLSMSPMPRNLGAWLFPMFAAASAGLAPGAPLLVGTLGFGLSCWSGFNLRHATRAFRARERDARAAGTSASPRESEVTSTSIAPH
jgi:predicted MFS family arabinose efflux permease